jgi:hypothetical protein
MIKKQRTMQEKQRKSMLIHNHQKIERIMNNFLEKFRKGRKGISSIFIAIYIALLTVVLISSLFIGLTVSNSSLDSYLLNEQNRSQESILIGGGVPKSLQLDLSTGSFTSLIVNNTGAIMVRIKALYVAGVFVCDPSKLAGDSYISPQKSLRIDLSTISTLKLNDTTLNGSWVLATERGTTSSDTGLNLLYGLSIQTNDPDRVYFGPLMLTYSMFHWSNDGGATWHAGWTIPSGTSNVIWRILIANVDKRPITLSTSSSFTLIQNSQQQNKIASWLIGPSNLNPPSLNFNAGAFHFIYFSVNGPNSLSYMYTPNPISSNFLTFIGDFTNSDGTHTTFGQTIPFEAVLVT